MKIPDAYFNGGLGQRVAQPAGAFIPDGSGAAAIGQAAERLGKSLLQPALDANEQQGRIDLMHAHERRNEAEQKFREQQAELKQQAKETEIQTANSKYFAYAPQLDGILKQIVADENIHQDEYPAKMRELGLKHAEENLYPHLNTHQKYLLQPHLLSEINKKADEAHKTGMTELQDIAKEQNITNLEELKNDPTRPTRTKIEIINDDNFFAGTGLTSSEIQTRRLTSIQEIIKEDVDAKFNSTKQDLKSLRAFKADIQNKDKAGHFTYMPEMDLAERNSAVNMVMAKEESLINQAEQRQREVAAATRQKNTDLVMLHKDLVQTGWQPNTASDFRYLEQVRRAASTSPSLARQYEVANSYLTDFSKRMELKKADPLGVAAAERGVQLQPLNILDVASLPQQIAGRLNISRQLGVKAVFKGDEIKALSEYLQTLPPKGQVQLMNSLSKPLGPAISAATFNSAAEQVRQDRPDQAVMFRLYGSGKPAEAQLYAEGRAWLTGEKKDLLKDKFTIVQQQAGDRIDKLLGSALSSLPKTRNTIKDAIATVYLAEVSRRNISLDSLDKDLLADVTRRVAGETTRTGGRYFGSGKTTIVPAGMTGDQMLNSIKAITPQDIAKRGGVDGMSDAEAATFIKGRAWHESEGGYVFDREGKTLYRKDGRPFVFRFDGGVGAK